MNINFFKKIESKFYDNISIEKLTMPSEIVEIVEEFAPENFDFNMNPQKKRYALRSSTNTNSLIKENLQQIQNSLNDSDSDDENEKNRYLKLELANKELEILELKEKNDALEKVTNALKEYNAVLEVVFKNVDEYEKLCKSLNYSNYREIVKKEMILIKPHKLPDSMDLIPLYIRTSCKYVYTLKSGVEKSYADKINKTSYYNETLLMLQKLFTGVIIILYIYYFIGLK